MSKRKGRMCRDEKALSVRRRAGESNGARAAAARLDSHEFRYGFRRITRWAILCGAFLLFAAASAAEFKAGAAKVDITPRGPIRLSGYAVRAGPSQGVAQRLYARALALQDQHGPPVILVAVDNCGVPASVAEAAAKFLSTIIQLPRANFVVCSSHTHAGPMLTGVLANLFSAALPADQQAAIDRYTRELEKKIEQAALMAVRRLEPADLGFGWTKAFFAKNRRTPGGPVDWSVPVLRVAKPNGELLAVLATYSCHGTTLGGDFNKVCGDWIGYGAQELEKRFPGAVALLTIGCGADANPYPRGTLALAQAHGKEIADVVERAALGGYTALRGPISCQLERIELPFDKIPHRAEWERRAKLPGIVGYHARKNLAKLDRGERLPDRLPYSVQAWRFDHGLAMVFLAGEVPVDYALRLKDEFDATRLWIAAYANDVPCYIPSRRILAEGGYEAETSLWYYDRPARFQPIIEDQIIAAARRLLPERFKFNLHRAEFPPPKSPEESLASMRTDPQLKVELVAAEPLVVDPVAIDFGPDGKLWVVEMRDYPEGMDGHYKPGGRIKYLEDTDGDGKYDRATIFLDDAPFPTGVMAWRKGALICAAPDILYAQDLDGDGKADKVEKLFTGFATHNYQARVNGLSYGLDHWVYGAAGLFGGDIHSLLTGKTVPLRGRDFRLNPDTGDFEPAAGLSQQGRVRDDWGDWFGCDNSNLLWQFPFPEEYIRRNPYALPPSAHVALPRGADPNQLYPISRTLQRFNEPNSANRTTSACGLGIYRDVLLGPTYAGNAFICEPVHNLVRRFTLSQSGAIWTADAATEHQSEFLASTDNWFRPVQAITGPDGALWVVDMYRFVIEHPDWISKERLAELDVRAGCDQGRIYRIVPRKGHLRAVPRFDRANPEQLAAYLESPNGVIRDRAEMQLVWQKARQPPPAGTSPAAQRLEALIRGASNPASRIQALSTLAALGGASEKSIEMALADPDARARQFAIRTAEKLPARSARLTAALLALRSGSDPRVVMQLAFALGDGKIPGAEGALAQIALEHLQDPFIRGAVLSSAAAFPETLLADILDGAKDSSARAVWIDELVGVAAGEKKFPFLERLLSDLLRSPAGNADPRRWENIGALLRAFGSQPELLPAWKRSHPEQNRRLHQTRETALRCATDSSEVLETRVAALKFLRSSGELSAAEWERVGQCFDAGAPLPVQEAALETAARSRAGDPSAAILNAWDHFSPAMRGRATEVLLSRTQWSRALLAAAERARISRADVPTAARNRLRQSRDLAIRQAAIRLFPAAESNRQAIVRRFAPVSGMKGDALKGASLFAKNCTPCHYFRNQGNEVGPNLAALTDTSAPTLLLAILDPNAAVDERYRSFTIEMRDGRSLSGIVAEESAAGLTLLQANGRREPILRSDIEKIRASNLSLMPEGFEQVFSAQDLADLIAYLQGK